MNAVVQLPDVSSARLPATYEAAKSALAECSRIDECQEWANKAEAMASYARQAKDDTLRKMADRIQSRAIRRCQELLRQFPEGHGGDRKSDQVVDAHNLKTQRQTALAAGMSDWQYRTAMAVGDVAEEEFERLVESENPPTVTQLADLGKQSRPQPIVDLGGIDPRDYARATEAQGTLRRFAEFCQKNDPQRIALACKPHESADLRRFVSTIDGWLDQFVINLAE